MRVGAGDAARPIDADAPTGEEIAEPLDTGDCRAGQQRGRGEPGASPSGERPNGDERERLGQRPAPLAQALGAMRGVVGPNRNQQPGDRDDEPGNHEPRRRDAAQ